MIYGSTSDGGIIIGLSAGNVEQLKIGRPIITRLPGAPVLRIFYCETEEQLFAELEKAGVLPAASAMGTKQ